jgi:hypothetical protein
MPVAARSKAWVCGSSVARFVGSNPAGGMDVCCECYMLLGRGLCDGLVIRPKESYCVRCVIVKPPTGDLRSLGISRREMFSSFLVRPPS